MARCRDLCEIVKYFQSISSAKCLWHNHSYRYLRFWQTLKGGWGVKESLRPSLKVIPLC